MTAPEKIICVGCPMGCLVTLTISNRKVTAIEGHKCKQGENYVLEEYRNPVRILTTTLLTQGSSQPLLPVRTAKPIPKVKMMSSVRNLAKVRAKPPVKIGEVVVAKLTGIGVDVVATADLLD
jgi:CxxC motif-containing protein